MFVQRTLQRLLFQFHVRYTLIIVRMFGVWPYLIDDKSKTVRTCWCLKLYPLSVLIFFVAAVALSSSVFKSNIIWHSVAANIFMFLYVMFFGMSFLAIFIDQHYKFKAIEALIRRCHRLYTIRISKLFVIEEFSFVRLLLLYTFKSIIMIIYACYCIMTRIYLTSIVGYSSFLGFIGSYYVISIVPNLFYGTMLSLYFLFQQVNIKIKQVSGVANALSAVGAEIKQNFRMQRFCELSDGLDEIAVLHLELCNIANAINGVVSFQLISHFKIYEFVGAVVLLVHLRERVDAHR